MGLTNFPNIAASDIANVDTVQNADFGTLAYGNAIILVGTNVASYQTDTSTGGTTYDGNMYIYLKGVANTVAGSFVVFDEVGVTALATTSTAAGAQVAVATAVTDSATEYGWYLIHGTGVVATNGDVSDNARMQTTAGSNGNVDDTTTANKYLNNAFFRGATTSGAAAFTIGQVSWSSSNVAA